MNDVPSGERLHIGLFGRRNAGKSSLLNVLTGQAAAVVSETPGTTTDPVSKAMELLPIGPVVFIDTPGFDDAGSLGELRVARTRQVLEKTDIALLVMDACVGKTEDDEELAHLLSQRGIPFLAVYTKDDLCGAAEDAPELRVSAETGQNIESLKEQIARLASQRQEPPPLVGDLVRPGDLVVLVTPIDDAAPKGRLILPQPGLAGHRCGCRCVQGDRAGPDVVVLGQKARPYYYRQPGVPAGGGRGIRRHPPHVLFHPDGPSKGPAGCRCAGDNSHCGAEG